jgi:hypothetical protein
MPDNIESKIEDEAQESSENKEIENPTALLNAYERTKEEKKKIAAEKAELEKRYQGIDINRYHEMLQEREQMAKERSHAEEEKLIKEQNWEALLGKKTAQIEEQYTLKLDKASSDLTSTKNELLSTSEQLAIATSKVDELTRKFAAYDTFIANKGKSEAFKYVWEGELRNQTKLSETGDLQLLKASGSEDPLYDEEGNEVNVSQWMQKFRVNGGSPFFNPITEAAGSGASPQSANIKPQQTGVALIIERSQLGNIKAMKAIAAQLEDGNINKAIGDGRVVVK